MNTTVEFPITRPFNLTEHKRLWEAVVRFHVMEFWNVLEDMYNPRQHQHPWDYYKKEELYSSLENRFSFACVCASESFREYKGKAVNKCQFCPLAEFNGNGVTKPVVCENGLPTEFQLLEKEWLGIRNIVRGYHMLDSLNKTEMVTKLEPMIRNLEKKMVDAGNRKTECAERILNAKVLDGVKTI